MLLACHPLKRKRKKKPDREKHDLQITFGNQILCKTPILLTTQQYFLRNAGPHTGTTCPTHEANSPSRVSVLPCPSLSVSRFARRQQSLSSLCPASSASRGTRSAGGLHEARHRHPPQRPVPHPAPPRALRQPLPGAVPRGAGPTPTWRPIGPRTVRRAAAHGEERRVRNGRHRLLWQLPRAGNAAGQGQTPATEHARDAARPDCGPRGSWDVLGSERWARRAQHCWQRWDVRVSIPTVSINLYLCRKFYKGPEQRGVTGVYVSSVTRVFQLNPARGVLCLAMQSASKQPASTRIAHLSQQQPVSITMLWLLGAAGPRSSSAVRPAEQRFGGKGPGTGFHSVWPTWWWSLEVLPPWSDCSGVNADLPAKRSTTQPSSSSRTVYSNKRAECQSC